ncbi:MAG: GatB/YqeY domain-containing protein [Candidatus Nomurabacteria bacterium GW2011_GWF2_43_8]|uniref:GatB/YqeY domain-containing protein n=3 Tax=Candidatus Nomuraibacteriota TaxID=1752729 RepID=A0A0G1FSH0_9BACT|nr:MAG: GatB/YqeY domain-containing protein [Candidatus Nomurabacteria bacterium GW2011_GWA2_43_15]KKT19127.1 MAG: GatB/YqeY domain-containing protein [Candidatus Nomurabacteria bacterium GW2011_GWB1_43_7]KKT25018.1 MAG: GatB/YqeY domain-containing protein [Candidatus Nomurabacteria bacterium GW2011_GWF2_43_8]
MLHEQVKNGVKEAMLAKDAGLLKARRNILAAFTNELVAQKRKPIESLSDEEALKVIERMVKKAKKAIEMFKQGGRADLVAEEEAEIKIFESYLSR